MLIVPACRAVPLAPPVSSNVAECVAIERWLNDRAERLLCGAKTGRSDRGEGVQVPIGTSFGFQIVQIPPPTD